MAKSPDSASPRTLRLLLKFLRRGNWSAIRREFRDPPPTNYERWRELHRSPSRSFPRGGPKFSIVLQPGGGGGHISSIQRQIYSNWELLADDEESQSSDSRIRRVERHAAIDSATGQFVCFLDAGDELADHALLRLAEEIDANPSLDVIYSDEDRISPTGEHFDPFFKPDWSPEYFLGWAYTGRLAAYRRDLILDAGGIHSEFAEAFEYDLMLRLVARGASIGHIPDVLYHRAESHSIAPPAAPARRALESKRSGVFEKTPDPFDWFRVRYPIVGNPLVSIVIPSACRPVTIRNRQTWFLLECVSSIRRLTSYPNIEIIALDNNDMPADLAAALRPFEVRIVHFSEEFNLTRKINLGASHARGEQLLLLNDDIEVITPDWIESMLEYSQQPQIGAVGAKLLFPSNTQQHTGVILLNGNPRHPFYGEPADHPGYFHSSQVVRNWSAVTGACMMTRAENYKQVGGFSENFPLNYNDIDYCLKLLETGKRIVCTPHAVLYHHESVSKTGTYRKEFESFHRKWQTRFPRDPYYNPNLGRHFRVKV